MSRQHFRLAGVLLILVLCAACSQEPEISVSEHIEKARNFFQQKKLNDSVIELKNALQKDSNLPEARWLLGQIYLTYGNAAAAQSEISRAQALGFQSDELEVALLKVLNLQSRYQDVLDKSDALQDSSADLLTERGEAYFGLKEFDKAHAEYSRALSIEASSGKAKAGLARLAIVRSKFDEASAMIDEILGQDESNFDFWLLKGQLAFIRQDLPAAEDAFRKAAELASYSSAAQFNLVRALLAQEKPKEALEPIKEVRKRQPKHPLAKYFLAYIALLNDEPENAKTLLLEVIKVIPNHGESLLLLSRILFDEGNLEQAKDHISTFLAIYPRHIPALKLSSIIHLRLQQSDAAIENLNNAAKEVENDGQIMALLGGAYMDSGQFDKGVKILQEAVQKSTDKAPVHTQLAMGHLKAGDIDSAITELQSAIEIDSNLLQADIILILTLLDLNRLDEVIIAAGNLLEKDPESPLPYNFMGAAYLGKRDSEKARKQFEKALQVDPAFTLARINLATMELRAGNREAAREQYEEILKVDKNNVDALFNLAVLENEKTEIDKMVALLQKNREANPQAIAPRILLSKYYRDIREPGLFLEIVRETRDIAPNNTEVLILLGEAQRMNNLTDESTETFKSLVKLVPDSIEALLQLSYTQFLKGDSRAAKQYLEQILEKESDHFAALIAIVRLAIHDKDLQLADKHFSAVKKLRPDAPEVLLLEGDLLIAREQPEQAIKFYLAAVEITKSSDLIIKLARAYSLSGMQDKAISTMKEWLEEYPTDDLADAYLSSLYERDEDPGRAIENYERLLKKNPDNVIVLNNLANLYLESNQERALELAQRAFALLPDRFEVIDTLGWVLVKQNKPEEGMKHLRSARAIDAGDPNVNYHYAFGLAISGEVREARSVLKKVLEEHKIFDERENAQTLLNSLN